MNIHYCDEAVTLYHGDCREVLASLPDASVDSVVTDPPYGLEFMGKDWDRPWAVSARAGVGYEGRNELTLPSHRDNRNPNCRTCKGRARGKNRCTCTLPNWDRHPKEDMLAFQLWCTEWAAEALRVLKPGGHLLAFGGTRTWHRLAVAIEDAGFEIRDSIAWMYGSGFPKSHNVAIGIDKAAGAMGHRGRRVSVAGNRAHGQDVPNASSMPQHQARTPDAARWQGWGTALKPAHEPIVVARKPLIGTVAANVLEHGTGGLNIDGCRIGFASDSDRASAQALADLRAKGRRLGVLGEPGQGASLAVSEAGDTRTGHEDVTTHTAGRWPANVVLDEDQAAALDEQSGLSAGKPERVGKRGGNGFGFFDDDKSSKGTGRWPGDTGGGASRFFYVAKAPAKERPKVDGIAHPTVKPLTLMRWLCRLVTPPGGVILEPFAGSGTTVQAAVAEGFRCIAIEREDDYLPLILSRLTPDDQEPDDGQLTLDASA